MIEKIGPTIHKPGVYKSPGLYNGAGGIYKGRGVYNDGAGGGLPPGVILFNKIKNIIATNGSQFVIDFYQNNTNCDFIVDFEITEYVGNGRVTIINDESSLLTKGPMIQPSKVNNTIYLTNKHSSNTSYSGNLPVLNTRYKTYLKNSGYYNFENDALLKSGVPYESVTYDQIAICKALEVKIILYEISIRKNGDYLYQLIPATYNDDPGLFDIVNNVFYPPQSNNWVVEN